MLLIIGKSKTDVKATSQEGQQWLPGWLFANRKAGIQWKWEQEMQDHCKSNSALAEVPRGQQLHLSCWGWQGCRMEREKWKLVLVLELKKKSDLAPNWLGTQMATSMERREAGKPSTTFSCLGAHDLLEGSGRSCLNKWIREMFSRKRYNCLVVYCKDLWIVELRDDWVPVFLWRRSAVSGWCAIWRHAYFNRNMLSSGKHWGQKKWFYIVFIWAAGIQTVWDTGKLWAGTDSPTMISFGPKGYSFSDAVISCREIWFAIFFWTGEICASHFSKSLWNIGLFLL